ncbi:hypothetical protein [Microbacterium atlanticum]|uniref:hypothetical protein n=1 Tax=Microbacterium atlanticum TaxID=2782168 RepID=UPI0018880169|nr:hypothetical protein [Microbacterium atlanticum]
MRVPVGAVVIAIISGVLLLGGAIVLFASSAAEAASFGWFAYQPLAGAVFFPGSLIVMTPLMTTAAAVGIIGLVGLGATAGYVLGRRRAPRAARDGSSKSPPAP